MLLGTDNTGGPGFVHVEMELFQSVGFAPWEVLRMATLEAATAEGVEQDLGTLEVGKLADFVVIPVDYMIVPAEDIWKIKPDMTVIGGEVVFSRPVQTGS